MVAVECRGGQRSLRGRAKLSAKPCGLYTHQLGDHLQMLIAFESGHRFRPLNRGLSLGLGRVLSLVEFDFPSLTWETRKGADHPEKFQMVVESSKKDASATEYARLQI